MPTVNNWEEWDEVESELNEDEKRDRIKQKNSKTDKQRNENRWKEPQKLVYRKKNFKWLLLVALLLTACEDNLPSLTETGVSLNGTINPRLGEPDENGYYHIKLSNTWQTTHRLSGMLWYEGLANLEEGEKMPAENVKVFWESSHYWELSDTLGYYI